MKACRAIVLNFYFQNILVRKDHLPLPKIYFVITCLLVYQFLYLIKTLSVILSNRCPKYMIINIYKEDKLFKQKTMKVYNQVNGFKVYQLIT